MYSYIILLSLINKIYLLDLNLIALSNLIILILLNKLFILLFKLNWVFISLKKSNNIIYILLLFLILYTQAARLPLSVIIIK